MSASEIDNRPVIFLDIDGVLNTHNYLKELESSGYPKSDVFGPIFNPLCVDTLREIIDEVPDVGLVISSSWRIRGMKHLRELWKVRNLPGELIDTTPIIQGKVQARLGDENALTVPEDVYTPRGVEIAWWVHQYRSWGFKKYCIIDDDPDMILTQSCRFVRTTMAAGLQPFHKEQALTALSGKPIPHEYEDIALTWEDLIEEDL